MSEAKPITSSPALSQPRLSRHSREFDWIAEIAAHGANAAGQAGDVGIGDDAAVISTSGAQVLVATDTLLSGVHFEDDTPARLIGRKAIAVNLSDIAAMAGVPKFATVAVSLPKDWSAARASDLMHGLQELAQQFGVAIVGGDTTSWHHPLAVTVTVVGEVGPQGPMTRAGGQSGDLLIVSGALGGSIAEKHLAFTPRVHEALKLVSEIDVHAMIDLSDGLASDVRHLAVASGCGAVIEAEILPISDHVTGDRVTHALADGEDFELLAAIAPADRARMPEGFVVVGQLVDNKGVWLSSDGTLTPLDTVGFSHPLGESSETESRDG